MSSFYELWGLIREAEWVNRERLQSDQAALQILLPYQNSNWHFVAAVVQGRLAYPGHPIQGVSVKEFLENGFTPDTNMELPEEESHNVALVQIIDRNARIACEDGKAGNNPWQWKNFDHEAMLAAAKKFGYKDDMRQFEDPRQLVQHAWRRPVKDEEGNADWRQDLAYNIYNKSLRALAGYDPRKQSRVMNQAQVDIVSAACPISVSPSVVIYNLKVVREAARFQLPSGFRGVNRRQGFFSTPTSADKTTHNVDEKLNAHLDNIVHAAPYLLRLVKGVQGAYDEWDEADAEEKRRLVQPLIGYIRDFVYDLEQAYEFKQVVKGLWKVSKVMGMLRSPEINQQVSAQIRPGIFAVQFMIGSFRDYAGFLHDYDHSEDAQKLENWATKLEQVLTAFQSALARKT